MSRFSRRDALKLLASLPVGMALSRLLYPTGEEGGSLSQPNIIVVVLDSLTARNMSLHGYRRETTPNIARFAEGADVYHAHHSAGTFTTAGTSSLLTGTYPWTHRGINMKGLMLREHESRNVFNLLNPMFNRTAYTQNYLADYILLQFGAAIDRHLPMGSFSKLDQFLVEHEPKDALVKFRTANDFLVNSDNMGLHSGALVYGTIYDYLKSFNFDKLHDPTISYHVNTLLFDIREVFSGLSDEIMNLKPPFFAYYHLYPPHSPYAPKAAHQNMFDDDWAPDIKPGIPLDKFTNSNPDFLKFARRLYDQYLVTVDEAFGDFMANMDENGQTKNSIIILTSDHGESFERNYIGHIRPLVYEPSIHIPLLISIPGQTTRRDFYQATNSVDVLPTLLHLCGIEIPDWVEGQVLPGFNPNYDEKRANFSMVALTSPARGELHEITAAMFKENYKLIYYRYKNDKELPDEFRKGIFELYHLKDDPEEMYNLVELDHARANRLKSEFLSKYHLFAGPLS